MTTNGRLDARDREALLDRLAGTEFDVLVIGGGITGAGAALDAASRGLRVALVEARDLASGPSSRSSKLIHGGLRYLEQFDFKLVWEALRERDLLVSKLAPHLVKPVSFLYPLHRKVLERPYVGAGLVLYDAMEGTKRPVPHHRHLTVRGALRMAPGLTPSGLAGALLYYDAQTDHARSTVIVARTAAAHGAVIGNQISAQHLLRAGSPAGGSSDFSEGRVVGAHVRDEESGRELDVNAKRVVLCTGVWTDLVHELSGIRAGYKVRMSKGVHLVVPYEAIRSDTGIILRTEKSVLFIIPWGQRWIVGTTDTDWTGDRAEPTATGEDIDYILAQANRILARPLTRADVIGGYAGLRPGRQVHHRPADGPGRDRRGRGRLRPLGARLGHRPAAAAGRGRAGRRGRRGGTAGRGLRAAPRGRGAPARPVRDPDRGGPGADPGRPLAGPAAGRGAPVPAGRGGLRRCFRRRPARGRRAGPPGPAVHRDRGPGRR